MNVTNDINVTRLVSGDEQVRANVEFTLSQTLHLLTECIAQPHEAISRLGCACVRCEYGVTSFCTVNLLHDFG